MPDFASGFESVHQEQPSVEVAVIGRLPHWLEGTLLRNGPGLWHAGITPLRHWFDGFAMLHAFTLAGGKVSYRNRFLQSPDRQAVQESGRLRHPQYATDPCRTLFKKVTSLFVPEVGANTNVNVTRLGRRWLALTETPMALEFDPETLETLGLYSYDSDGLQGQMTTAHPAHDGDTLYSFVVKLGRTSKYRGYRTRNGPREVFAEASTRHPAYMHSCALTRNELLLWEGPLVVQPTRLLWRDRPFIENYRWRPELGSRLWLLNRSGGARAYELPARFVFHHVQSFYEKDTLCVDVLAYRDARVIEELYLDRLLAEGPPVDVPELVRVRLRSGRAEMETLSTVPLELPRLLEPAGQNYRYVYGISRRDSRFYDALARVDSHSGEALTWHEPGCYPGEPVPVASPRGEQWVVLSAVLDTARQCSFLLVLDGQNMRELARAYVPARVPFGFHGGFIGAAIESDSA